jgi:hypothetical protein
MRLPVLLTEQQRLMLGEQLVELRQRERKIDHHRKLASRRWANRINDLREGIDAVTDTLASGEMDAEVECEERFNFSDGTVEVWRMDTGEFVIRRPMSAHERQLDIDPLAQINRKAP